MLWHERVPCSLLSPFSCRLPLLFLCVRLLHSFVSHLYLLVWEEEEVWLTSLSLRFDQYGFLHRHPTSCTSWFLLDPTHLSLSVWPSPLVWRLQAEVLFWVKSRFVFSLLRDPPRSGGGVWSVCWALGISETKLISAYGILFIRQEQQHLDTARGRNLCQLHRFACSESNVALLLLPGLCYSPAPQMTSENDASCTCDDSSDIRRPRRRPPIKHNLGKWSLAASDDWVVSVITAEMSVMYLLPHVCLSVWLHEFFCVGAKCVCSIILSGKTEGKGQVADLTLFPLCPTQLCEGSPHWPSLSYW